MPAVVNRDPVGIELGDTSAREGVVSRWGISAPSLEPDVEAMRVFLVL